MWATSGRCVLALFLMGVGGNLFAQAEDIPAEAQTRALAALARLGPTRGAKPIAGRVLDIVGGTSSLKGVSLALKRDLRDLNARVLGQRIEIALSGDVLFDFDRWTVRPQAEPLLEKVLAVIRNSKALSVVVDGHTDSVGSRAYNRELSLRRAQAVRDWLMRKGHLPPDLFSLNGYGEDRPVAPNTHADGSDHPEGRQKNRRVSFVLTTQER